MLGVCTVFFWTAAKVHTNNALFVYCQRCESGGTLFYYWNRIVFISLYCSIIVFSGVLVLKHFPRSGVAFFMIGLMVIFYTDQAIKSKFVVHSLHLPLSQARIHDTEEAVALISETKQRSGKKQNFMYRSPELNHANWDTIDALYTTQRKPRNLFLSQVKEAMREEGNLVGIDSQISGDSLALGI